MRKKNLIIVICLVLVTGGLLGLEGCSSISSESTQTKETATVPKVDDTTAEWDVEGQNDGTESKGCQGDCVSNDIQFERRGIIVFMRNKKWECAP